MSNNRSTWGGAFSALGTSLIGVGVVPQLTGAPSKALTYIALAGFICQGVGTFFGHLFAADSRELSQLTEKVNGGTTQFTKPPSSP